jgi:lysophospholipase L1-like esterase
MRRAAGRDGVWVLAFDPTESGLPDLYLDYIHLNADGHRIAAEKLLELLTSPSGPGLPD